MIGLGSHKTRTMGFFSECLCVCVGGEGGSDYPNPQNSKQNFFLFHLPSKVGIRRHTHVNIIQIHIFCNGFSFCYVSLLNRLPLDTCVSAPAR